jgi:hypothetical protein
MKTEEVILKFIDKMHYLSNEHVLGIVFYGSMLTGYSTNISDIDLHIIFDDSKPNEMIRGYAIIDGNRIEYFEKSITEIYRTINYEFNNQNNAMLSIIGQGKIIWDKTGSIKKLQNYTLETFARNLPKVSSDEAKEMVSIINNRMLKLKQKCTDKAPEFIHLYHLTVEKIRKFYHKINGYPEIQTSKVVKIYTDNNYRQTYNKGLVPEKEFIDMYLSAIYDQSDNQTKINKIEELYTYAKRDINLENEYRIHIKSRVK